MLAFARCRKGMAISGCIGAACIAMVIAASPAGATTVYSNDFTSSTAGFSGGALETYGVGQWLAGFQRSTATLTISGLAANSSVSLSFDLYALNSVDGDGQSGGGPDYFNVSLNGSNIFHYTFANYGHGDTQNYPSAGSAPGTGATAYDTLNSPNCCGNQYADSTYSILLSGLANASGIAQFVFNDASNETYTNEHYGIDNVLVAGTLAASTTPLPAALPLFASGLGGLGLLQWRRRQRAAKRTA